MLQQMRIARVGLGLLSIFLVFTSSAFAGAKIEINEDAYIDIGLRLQAQYYSTEKDLDGDGNYDSFDDFKLRRSRLRVKGVFNEFLDVFMQTEIAEDTSGSADMRIIDAFAHFTADPWLQLYMGENMVPVMRQNLTSSAALMAIDRPGLVYKNLSWGLKSKYAFTNETYSDSSGALSSTNSVRDMGLTVFGSDEIADQVFLKYYLGASDGVQEAGKSNNRYAGRVQLNLLEDEKAYYNKSTYLGKKKTIGIGAAFDSQSDIAIDKTTGKNIDYSMYTVDFFAEMDLIAESVISFETAYVNLDLGDADTLQSKSASDGSLTDISGSNGKQAQGDGFYVQSGILIGKWQPWIEYEAWDSDASSGKGGYDLYRFGVSYFFEGQSTNLKAGYEMFEADQKIGTSNEDSVGTFLLGLYINY
jgi:hypothetical protein